MRSSSVWLASLVPSCTAALHDRYMAPEVARGLPANETADVYSFAVVLWEMVSIELPYQFYGLKDLTER